MKNSLLVQPEGARFVKYSQVYIDICGGGKESRCPAVLLSAFEFLSNGKLANAPDGAEPPWVRRSLAELRRDIFNLYGRMTIIKGLKQLEDLGYLERRSQPDKPLERVAQEFRLCVEAINARLIEWRANRQPMQKCTGPNMDQSRNGPDAPQNWSVSGPGAGPNMDPLKEEEKEVKESLSSASADPTDFVSWWKRSPRRGSRQKALAEWNKILKRHPGAERAAVVAELDRGLDRAMRSAEWLRSMADRSMPGAYIVHMNRFLRDDYWRDEHVWTPSGERLSPERVASIYGRKDAGQAQRSIEDLPDEPTWQKISEAIDVGPADRDYSVGRLKSLGVRDGVLRLVAPTMAIKQTIEYRLLDRIEKCKPEGVERITVEVYDPAKSA